MTRCNDVALSCEVGFESSRGQQTLAQVLRFKKGDLDHVIFTMTLGLFYCFHQILEPSVVSCYDPYPILPTSFLKSRLSTADTKETMLALLDKDVVTLL